MVLGPESTGKSTLCNMLAQQFNTQWCPEYARAYLMKHGPAYTFHDLLTIAKGQLALEEEYVQQIQNPNIQIQNSNIQIPNSNTQIQNPNTQIPNSNAQIPNSKSQFPIPNSSSPIPNSSFQIPHSSSPIPNSPSPIHHSSLIIHHSPLLFLDTDQYVMKVWCEYVFNDCHNWILQQIATRQYDLYLLCKPDLPWVKDDLREYPDEKPRQELFHIYRDLLMHQSSPWVEISGTYAERFAMAEDAVNRIMLL